MKLFKLILARIIGFSLLYVTYLIYGEGSQALDIREYLMTFLYFFLGGGVFFAAFYFLSFEKDEL